MKKIINLCILCIFCFPLAINANIICNDGTVSPSCGDCHRGCCSHHGGCSSASAGGRNYNSNNNNYNSNRTVKRTYAQPKSSNTSISSITINDNVISTIKTINYLTVESHIANISVNLSDLKASYSISGDANLKLDQPNIFNILVTAEDGTTKVYTLSINRKIAKSDVMLTLYLNDNKVDFNGKNTYTTSKKFKNNKVTFKYETSDGLNNVKIYKGKKEINGEVNLKKGKNKIRIILTDINGDQNIYRVNINRKL